MSWNKFSLEKLDNYQIKLNKEVILTKLAIVQAKRDLKDLLDKLNKKEARFQNVISRKEYDLLRSGLNTLLVNLENLKLKFENVQHEHAQVKSKLRRMQCVKENLLKKLEDKKRSRTPRPDWNKFAEFIPGGRERWTQLTENLSSEQILDTVLDEIRGVNDKSSTTKFIGKTCIKNEYFKQLITEDSMIENLKLTFSDYLRIVLDIFESKVARKENINEFLLIYFENKYKCKQKALRWSINIVYHSLLFTFTEQLRIFSEILNNSADEDIYSYFLKSAFDLFALLYSISCKESSLSVNKIRVDSLKKSMTIAESDSGEYLVKIYDFKVALKQHFKNLSDDDLKELVRYARYDFETFYKNQNALKDELKLSEPYMQVKFDVIDFRVIFLESDRDGQCGYFLNKVLRMLHAIRRDYVARICFYLIKKQVIANQLCKENKKSVELKSNLKLKKKKKKLKKKSSVKKKDLTLDLSLDENIFKLIEDESLLDELTKIRVSLSSLEEVFKEIDPNITDDEIARYTKWVLRGMNSSPIQLKDLNVKLLITELVKTSVYFH